LAHSGVFQGNFARDSWESSHICAEVKADFLAQDSRPAVRREGLLIEDGHVVLVLKFRGRQMGQHIPEVLPRFFRARAAQELSNPLFPGVDPHLDEADWRLNRGEGVAVEGGAIEQTSPFLHCGDRRGPQLEVCRSSIP